MRVAMIGTGYVGLVSGACFADFGHEVTCVDKDTGQDRRARRAARCRSTSRGSNDLVAANTRAGRLKFTNDLPGAVKAADAVFIAVGTPSRRGDGHADLSFVYDAAREIAARARRLHRGHHQIDRAGRHRRRGRAHHPRTRARRGFRGGVESGIPARRRRHPGFQASRPHRGRQRRCARARGDERALSAALSQPLADLVHRPAHRRTDQIRRQCLPRHQDHLHQRDRRSGRKSRRRRAGGRARHRARQPHRLEIPARRAGLWRLVLSQGHGGAAQDRPGSRRAAAHRRGGGGGQRCAQARDGAQGVGGAGRRIARQDGGRARTDVQAEHRRHARVAVDPADHRAAGHGRQGARLRSDRHGAGQAAAGQRRVLQGRL